MVLIRWRFQLALSVRAEWPSPIPLAGMWTLNSRSHWSIMRRLRSKNWALTALAKALIEQGRNVMRPQLHLSQQPPLGFCLTHLSLLSRMMKMKDIPGPHHMGTRGAFKTGKGLKRPSNNCGTLLNKGERGLLLANSIKLQQLNRTKH